MDLRSVVRVGFVSVAGTCGLAVSGSALAAAAGSAASASDSLEEVVVTAEKRSSTVQQTALAVNVISGEEMHAAGVEDFSTLYKMDPGVSVNASLPGGIGPTVISIDGIRPYNQTAVTQSPVSVNLDGINLANMNGLTGYFYDLQRMEILHGPQGTLYGRNAAAGAVNIITNKPRQEFGAAGELEFGNFGEFRTEGSLNVPLSSTFAVRFAARQFQHEGYYSNGLSDAHQQGARISALKTFSDASTLLASIDYENSNDRDYGLSIVGVRNLPATLVNGVYVINPPPNVKVPSDPFNDTLTLYPNGSSISTNATRNWGGQLTYTRDLGFATLTAQTGYRKTTAFAVFLQPPAPLFGGPTGTQQFPQNSHSYSGEVRLASTGTGPLQWVAGLFSFGQHGDGYICVTPTNQTPPFCVFKSGMYNHMKSYAAYAQGAYTPATLGGKLHLVLGARYNRDRVTSSDFESAVFFPPGGDIVNEGLENTGQKGTYKVGVNFDLGPDSLLYLSNSTGYRAPNFQFGREPFVPAETVHNWNLGSKNEFFNNRVRVNFDAFYNHYYGSERSGQTYPPPQAPFLPFSEILTYSTGEMRFRGASVATNFVITPDDQLTVSLQYIDATYLKFVQPAKFKNTIPLGLNGVPTGQPVGDYSGRKVGGVTPLSGNASFDHSWHIGDGRLTASLAAVYHGSTHMQDANPGTLTDVVQPSYVQGDVSLSYGPNNGNWSVTGWVRNVSDGISWSSAAYSSTASNGLVTAALNPPRTFGVTLRARIGGD
jgi:iron complex outermembrane receptor protein